MFKSAAAILALAGASLCSSPAMAADDIRVEGPGSWMMKWNRNISVDKPGFLFLPKELPGTLLINSFEATPFFGKDYVSVANVSAADPKVETLTTSIDWPNYATVVDKDVFGFQAIIIGESWLAAVRRAQVVVVAILFVRKLTPCYRPRKFPRRRWIPRSVPCHGRRLHPRGLALARDAEEACQGHERRGRILLPPRRSQRHERRRQA